MANTYTCPRCGVVNSGNQPYCRHCQALHESGYQPPTSKRSKKGIIFGTIAGVFVAILFLMGIGSFWIFRSVSAPSHNGTPTLPEPAVVSSPSPAPENKTQLILEDQEAVVNGNKVVVVGRFLQNDLTLSVSRGLDKKTPNYWFEVSGYKSLRMELTPAEIEILRQRIDRAISLSGGPQQETLFIRPKATPNSTISIKFNDPARVGKIRISFATNENPADFLLSTVETESLTQLLK